MYSKKVTAATCTGQGYTTYTCSCGHSYVDDYVNQSHNFSKYVCTKCGTVDKSNAYAYLGLYVKQKGTTYGANTYIEYVNNNVTYRLNYSAESGIISATRSRTLDSQFFYSALQLDSYFYGTHWGDADTGYDISGYLEPSEFTNNSPISYYRYYGANSKKQEIIELARQSCCELVEWLSWYLTTNNVGITVADLGFTAYT